MPESEADEAESFDEFAAIAAALQPYMDAARTGDGAAMRSGWFDHAHIVGTLGGALINLDADAFCRQVTATGGSPNVLGRIVSIDRQGDAACTRLEFLDWHGARYTDFLVLSKSNGCWKISSKVFDSHSKK